MLKLNYFTPSQIEHYLGFTVTFNQPVDTENYLFITTPLSKRINLSSLKAEFHLDNSVAKFDYDFFKSSDGMVIGSGEFCDILKKYEPEFNYIPIDGFYSHGEKIEKTFFIIHVGYKLDCFDYYNSEYHGKSLAINRLQNSQEPYLVNTTQQISLIHVNHHFFFVRNIIYFEPIITSDLADDIKQLCVSIEPINDPTDDNYVSS